MAARQQLSNSAMTSGSPTSLWIWCSGQMSGSPGSVFSLRAGSVTIDMTFVLISSGVSEMKIALP